MAQVRVVVGVAEPSCDPAGEFDQAIQRFTTAVVGAAGGEVAEERVFPLVQGAAKAGDLGDRAAGERGEDLLGDPPPVCVTGLVIDRAQLLRALPGDLDRHVALVGGEPQLQARALPVGQVFGAGAQDVADPIERVGLAAAVAVDLLLDTAADLVDRGGAELHDVESINDRDGVGELVLTRAKLVRTVWPELGQDGSFVVG